jgi:hypothetical protein
MASDLLIGYRLLQFGMDNEHKREVANLFIERAHPISFTLYEPINRRQKTAIEYRDVILNFM